MIGAFGGEKSGAPNGPPYALTCTCGHYFPCNTSVLCPYGCPWMEQCHPRSTPVSSRPVGTLRARCPRCGIERMYLASGRPLPI